MATVTIQKPRDGMILVEMPEALWPAITHLLREVPVGALGSTPAREIQRTLNDLDKAQTVVPDDGSG